MKFETNWEPQSLIFIIIGIYQAIFENLSTTTIILLYSFEIGKGPSI